MPKPKDERYLNLLAEHERIIAKLYTLFAKQLPKTSSFWQMLKAEEFQHTGMINELAKEVMNKSAWLSAERAGYKKIETSIQTVSQQITRWEQDTVSVRDAFKYAWLMEHSMVENDFFLPVQGDSPMAMQVMEAIRDSTQDHIARIHEASKKYARLPWYQRFISFWDDKPDPEVEFFKERD